MLRVTRRQSAEMGGPQLGHELGPSLLATGGEQLRPYPQPPRGGVRPYDNPGGTPVRLHGPGGAEPGAAPSVRYRSLTGAAG